MLLPGDFVEKKGLQNTSPSTRLQNTTQRSVQPPNKGSLQNIFKKKLPLPGVVSVQNRPCGICSILRFVEKPIRNPCCGLQTPVISPPRLFLRHVLACPSTSMKTFRPWDCHYLAAVADEFSKMCMVLIILPTYFLIFQLLVWCSCSALTRPDGFQNENAFRL